MMYELHILSSSLRHTYLRSKLESFHGRKAAAELMNVEEEFV